MDPFRQICFILLFISAAKGLKIIVGTRIWIMVRSTLASSLYCVYKQFFFLPLALTGRTCLGAAAQYFCLFFFPFFFFFFCCREAIIEIHIKHQFIIYSFHFFCHAFIALRIFGWDIHRFILIRMVYVYVWYVFSFYVMFYFVFMISA